MFYRYAVRVIVYPKPVLPFNKTIKENLAAILKLRLTGITCQVIDI